jgi:hypothetical protein
MPAERPLLTPEEHAGRELAPEEQSQRADLLRKLRKINKLT